MQEQLQALYEVKAFLDKHDIPNLIIGGIANAVWGRPRATRDADFKVMLGERTIDDLIALLDTQFKFRVSDPTAFARETYVVPIHASNGIDVDLGLGFLPYEEGAVAKAVEVEYEGVKFVVCSAEDLIIHKAISVRPKDWEDIEGVLARQGKQLDQAYIRLWLEQFAQALEHPGLLEQYESLLERSK